MQERDITTPVSKEERSAYAVTHQFRPSF